jgi:hypothetical protein
MKTITLDRYEITEGGTRSRINGPGLTEMHGIEQPWRDNIPFESCVPSGTYVLLPHTSPTKGDCFAMIGGTVSLNKHRNSDRYACLWHVANWASEVQGCVGVGVRALDSHKGPMVASSRNTLDLLRKTITEPWQLIIRSFPKDVV